MHILLTGAAGRIGAHTLTYLLERGHTVTALDLHPLPPAITEQHAELDFVQCDLQDYVALEAILDARPTIDGVIHFGAIPAPEGFDQRVVHNTNVVTSYNVLQTAITRGIKRVCQASSVNAFGLSFTPESHHRWSQMPVTETTPKRPEDPYGLSKAICELQADALTRYFPGSRIASLRFHHCKPSYEAVVPFSHWREGMAWTSYDACASAALLSLTSDGWDRHEVFNIVAPEICWEGDVSEKSKVPLPNKVGTLELMETHWKGRIDDGAIRKEWWEGNPRRSTFDSTKAERLLGWDHDRAGEV